MSPWIRAHGRNVYAWAAAILACVALVHGFRNYQQVSATKAYDMIYDWNGARQLVAGVDPYSLAGLKPINANLETGLGQVPTKLIWFLPIADLDLAAAKVVWSELTITCLTLHLLLLALTLRLPAPLPTVALLLGLVLSTSWMRDHLHVGQVSEQIAFLFTLAWLFLRRGNDVAAGVMLGLACTFKFYPGTLVLLLLVSGRWRLTLVALVVWLAFAIPVTERVGFHGWAAFLAQTKPYTTYWITHLKNSSIQGIVQRLHFPICEFAAAHRDAWAPGSYFASVLSLGLIAGSAFVGRRPAAQGRSVDLPFALYCIVAMITGPYTWEHYNVTLILPILVAGVALWRARRSGLGWNWTGAGIIVLLGSCGMLAVDIYAKNNLWDAYHYSTPKHAHHLLLHAYELSSFLPPLLLIGMILLLLEWARRRAPRAFDDLSLDAAAAAPA